MTYTESVLNELHAQREIDAAIHAAKYAAGGRPHPRYADEWVNLPVGFSSAEIVRSICARRGVDPKAIGFFPEGA